MSDIAIRVENLSKLYHIGRAKQRHDTLRDALVASVRGFGAALQNPKSKIQNQKSQDAIWALKDISFEVHRGEVLGIIGRNGAGKSTLLKILSRITEPTEGRAEIHGRVGSLLEVGTGFHPELTGRENIYLNGAILGMKRIEIERKFDEIVAFAAIEKFLDTPVKRYSSGMYVRLAFAVAAHLEPEILLVDEVLAVGDSEFQAKCLGKMQEVSHEGRAVLFVSHNLAAVRTLCQTGILLSSGVIAVQGSADQTVSFYVQTSSQKRDEPCKSLTPAPEYDIWAEEVSLIVNGSPSSVVSTGDEISVEVSFCARQPIRKPILGIVISSLQDVNVLDANNIFLPSMYLDTPSERGLVRCRFGAIPFMEGRYFVSVWLGANERQFQHLDKVLSFEVAVRDIWGTGHVPRGRGSLMWWPTEFEISECREQESAPKTKL